MNFGKPNVLILWLVNVTMGHAMHDGKCRRFATVGESDYEDEMANLKQNFTFIDNFYRQQNNNRDQASRAWTIFEFLSLNSLDLNIFTIAIAKVKMFSLFHRFSLIVHIIIFYNNKVGICLTL